MNKFIAAEEEALLTTKDVAAYLNLSIAWFHCKAVSGGGIPYIKIGNRRLYKKQDVLDWLKNHAQKIRSTSEYKKEQGGEHE